MTDAIAHSKIDIDEGACLALTGDAAQCGNGIDTDASDPDAGLCGIHAGTDATRVTDFENAAYASLRDDLVDRLRSESEAYALATLSPDIEEVWTALTSLQDLTIGPVELTASRACGRARDIADHPDLDVDDHPLSVGSCIALQGKSAKNHSCPNSGYGTALLCGMHKDADLRGTILDDGEPGPDLDAATVDGDEYQLVEQRDEDLIVVDVDEWELRRLDGAASAEDDIDEDTDDDQDDDVPPWLWSYDGPARLATYLRENYATTDRAKELAKQFETVDKFDAASFEEKLRAAGVHGGARNEILNEYDDVADLQYRARSGPALEQLDGVGSQSAHVVGQSFLSWSSMSAAPPQGWNAIVDDEPEIAPSGGPDDVDEDDQERGPLVRPQPAGSLPKYLVEGVEKQSPDRLRRLAEYAEEMADYREAEAERELEERAEQDATTAPDGWADDEWTDVVDDARDEADLAGGKGTLTTKTIDGRDYYYLQWREGSSIKSQYVAPVVPADSG